VVDVDELQVRSHLSKRLGTFGLRGVLQDEWFLGSLRVITDDTEQRLIEVLGESLDGLDASVESLKQHGCANAYRKPNQKAQRQVNFGARRNRRCGQWRSFESLDLYQGFARRRVGNLELRDVILELFGCGGGNPLGKLGVCIRGTDFQVHGVERVVDVNPCGHFLGR